MCGTIANHPKVKGNLEFLYAKTFELPDPHLGGSQKKHVCFSFNKISFSNIFQEIESHDVANVYKGLIENFLLWNWISSVGVLPFQPESQEKICGYSLVDSDFHGFWGA